MRTVNHVHLLSPAILSLSHPLNPKPKLQPQTSTQPSGMDEFSIMVTDVEDEENRRKLLEAGEDEEVDKEDAHWLEGGISYALVVPRCYSRASVLPCSRAPVPPVLPHVTLQPPQLQTLLTLTSRITAMAPTPSSTCYPRLANTASRSTFSAASEGNPVPSAAPSPHPHPLYLPTHHYRHRLDA